MFAQYKLILIILVVVTFLSYMSQRASINYEYYHKGQDGRKHIDGWLILLLIFLILFAGLRTNYNDTATYIKGYQNAESIRGFLSDSSNLKLTSNPLFYGMQAFFKHYTNNYSIFFMACSIFTNISIIRFLKKHSEVDNFVYTMFVFVTLGTLMLSVAALKQIVAMAVLTYAVDALLDKKYIKFYLIVFIAGLIHTYAWLYAFLPLLNSQPWGLRTYILLFGTIFLMYSFQSVIKSFLIVADQAGKNIPIEEVFDGTGMNIFRILVYSIVPVVTFMFKNSINVGLSKENQILIQMSIISLMFMLLASMNGANMFGRAGNYFVFGYIIILPWTIKRLFESKSARLLLLTAMVFFTAFYAYDNKNFGNLYKHKSLTQFISEVI